MKFLLDNGYKHWNTETIKGVVGHTDQYQKRMDTKPDFVYPLCNLNDKILINVSHCVFKIQEQEHESWEMYLVHENNDGYWCDLKIYSLNEYDIKENLEVLETKLLNMWEIFYGE